MTYTCRNYFPILFIYNVMGAMFIFLFISFQVPFELIICRQIVLSELRVVTMHCIRTQTKDISGFSGLDVQDITCEMSISEKVFWDARENKKYL